MESSAPLLFPRFSPAEFERRHRAVRDAMAREGIEALLIYGTPGGAEIPYLVNYLPASPCWLLFPRTGEPTVLVHFFNHIPCTRAQANIEDVRWYGPTPIPTLAALLEERGLAQARIGMVSLNTIPYNQVIELSRRLPKLAHLEFGRQMNAIRWVRSEEEITFLRRSGYLTDLACEALEHGLHPGLTEHEIRALIVGAFNGQESDPGIHFLATTSMTQPDRFVPWQRPSARTVASGDVLITELTVSYWSYGTQIHRPFAIGAPPAPVYRELFDVAWECYENIRRICRPGTTSEEIVEASAIIERRGFTTYDSLFHGERGKFPELGSASAVHPREPWTLKENMVHVIQPNPITRDQRAGLQLGAAVLVRPDGGEPLHNYPFKFPVCG
ncbi:MAG TPA: M24 family metallopeptidase [Candidatus Binataceae bacterium]|nr:M24 family metallopeptidase [Candidatus Binataceae bacterium]